jgi:hypothetical protein
LLAMVSSAALAAIAAQAPSGSGPVMVADFTNPGLSPSHWTLTIHPDGSGHFHSDSAKSSSASSAWQAAQDSQINRSAGEADIDPPGIDRDVQLSHDFAEHVFQVARQQNWFNEKCESHLKVAFQGWKKLTYDGPEGHGSCTFNFSQNKEIQALGDSLISVAETLREGERLEMLLQHDRLGLDQEMEYITAGAKDGRMQQICAIRGILKRLVDDDQVLERVRKRAQYLLAHAGS